MTDSNTSNGGGGGPASDPSNFLSPTPQVVKVVDTAREDLNGRLGTATSYNEERARYAVKIGRSVLSFKASNLQLASKVEKLRYTLMNFKDELMAVRNDPRLRHQLRQVYAGMQRSLPAPLTPERVLMGLAVLGVTLVWFLGVTRTLMLFSMLALPIAVSLPDLQAARTPREIATNFPANLRTSLAQTTGWNGIPQSVALGLYVLMLAIGVKVLMPTVADSAAAAASQAARDALAGQPPPSPAFDLKEVYRRGFEDAQSGKEFGASLSALLEAAETVDVTATTSASPHTHEYPPPPPPDDLHFPYNPPPTRKSKFGMGTMFCIFHLLRTAHSLAKNPVDGRLDVHLFMANVKNMEPWRMGLLALSVYKVVAALL